MGTTGEERWLAALRDHAAHLAFPDWTPHHGDWTHLHTGFTDDGTPYTEVAAYRAGDGGGHVRIHYRRYTGLEFANFWNQLMNQIAE